MCANVKVYLSHEKKLRFYNHTPIITLFEKKNCVLCYSNVVVFSVILHYSDINRFTFYARCIYVHTLYYYYCLLSNKYSICFLLKLDKIGCHISGGKIETSIAQRTHILFNLYRYTHKCFLAL